MGTGIGNVMKRCSVCDSTESYDTLADLGLAEKITSFTSFSEEQVIDRTGKKEIRHFEICNRCESSIQDALSDFRDEEVPEEKDDEVEVSGVKDGW